MQNVSRKFSVNENEQRNLKLNDEELNEFEEFRDLNPVEREFLKDLVFNLSMVLYKSFKHEPT